MKAVDWCWCWQSSYKLHSGLTGVIKKVKQLALRSRGTEGTYTSEHLLLRKWSYKSNRIRP